jgi:hypothetical protein
MRDAALLLRIRVITVSTRAAVRSLGAADAQVPDVVARGQSLLDRLEADVGEHPSNEVRLAFAQAREELESVGAEG